MNPLLREAIESVVRSFLKIGAGYLVEHGIWTQASATTYVEAAALALVGFGWSYWATYASRLKLMVAAAFAGLSENQIKEHIAASVAPLPAVTTLPTVVPMAIPIPPGPV